MRHFVEKVTHLAGERSHMEREWEALGHERLWKEGRGEAQAIPSHSSYSISDAKYMSEVIADFSDPAELPQINHVEQRWAISGKPCPTCRIIHRKILLSGLSHCILR